MPDTKMYQMEFPMYEYSDAYDEAEHGGEDGGPILFTRRQVINWLKQHGQHSPAQWFEYFKQPEHLLENTYTATSVLKWLNY